MKTNLSTEMGFTGTLISKTLDLGPDSEFCHTCGNIKTWTINMGTVICQSKPKQNTNKSISLSFSPSSLPPFLPCPRLSFPCISPPLSVWQNQIRLDIDLRKIVKSFLSFSSKSPGEETLAGQAGDLCTIFALRSEENPQDHLTFS